MSQQITSFNNSRAVEYDKRFVHMCLDNINRDVCAHILNILQELSTSRFANAYTIYIMLLLVQARTTVEKRSTPLFYEKLITAVAENRQRV